VLHPFAAASEVDSSVIMIRCANAADDLFTVKHTMLGMANRVLGIIG
jgi:hypothetical protein